MLECIVNISEGRRELVIDAIASAGGPDLLDVHVDPDHNRAVLTMLGEDAPRAVAAEAVGRLDLRRHLGVHPRIGVIDVVPFVALEDSSLEDAMAARGRFAEWIANELGVPAFFYGAGRLSLPEIRRGAFITLHPDFGPGLAHPTAGAVAVGAREILVAYNIWLAERDVELARSIASQLRGPSVRALALEVGNAVQVSMNLIEPLAVSPQSVYEFVASKAPVARAELVGLLPKGVLDLIDPALWEILDLGPDRTIESRQAQRSSRSRRTI